MIALATFLRDYGPWGLLALTLWTLRAKDADLTAEREGRRKDAAGHAQQYQDLLTRTVTMLERAATCMAAVTAALESRTGIFERLAGLVEEIKILVRDLERASEVADERVRDKLDANADRLRAILDAIALLRSGSQA